MTGFPLERYLARIGLDAPPAATAEGLIALARAQLHAIPFENLDSYLHQTVDIALAAVAEKLIARGRGGYCYELNGLLLAALTRLGFRAHACTARTHWGRASPGGRTHMVLRVEVGGGEWLVDCGFGAPGLREPMPFAEGTAAIQGHERFRFLRHGELGLLLQRGMAASGSWEDIYSISGEPALPIDFDIANHFTCSYPSSPFRSMLICGRTTPSGRALMRGATLLLEADGVARTRTIASGAEAVAALRADIGLALDDELAAAIERRWSPPRG